jgi:hypothetical protein
MEKYFVIVGGNGETSRANIEALMEDYYYANGNEGFLVLPYKLKPSQGQVFAAQYAKDKHKDILIFAPEDATHEGIPAASMNVTIKPFEEAASKLKSSKTSAFILWDDEDQDSQHILAVCKENDVPCFDLSDGLAPISAAPDIKAIKEPEFPKEEVIEKKEAPVVQEEEEEDYEDEEEDWEDDEEEDEVEDMENLHQGIEAIARIFAKVFIEELEKAKGDGTDKP